MRSGTNTWDAIIGDAEATEFVRTFSFGKDGAMPSKRFDENPGARAVRLVREHGGDYDWEWVAMCAISSGLG
jgi:hypothetical protein